MPIKIYEETKPMQVDTLQRFIFEKTDIRGEIIRLGDSFKAIMQQHHYPRAIFDILGQTLAATVLLSATLKYKGQLTVQFQSDGDVKLLVAKCNQNYEIRGLAQYNEHMTSTNKPHKPLFIGGHLVITVEPDNKVNPYQSIVPLTEPGIAANLENYFGQSVQIPTKIWLAVNEIRAVGMLLQLLPSQTQTIEERENFWRHAVQLGDTIKDDELLSLDNETILHRLYHEEDIRLYEAEHVQFKCQCSQERMNNVIKMLGKNETDDIFKTRQVIDITCEYCNTVYSFDRIDVAAILHD